MKAKIKEPIKVRFKLLNNGNQSIYFDIYQNGARRYEFLKLYLYPETNPANRQHNKETLTKVNVLKSNRLVELTNKRCGITHNDIADKITIGDFFKSYIEKKGKRQPVTAKLASFMLKRLQAWKLDKVRFSQVDKSYCEKVINKVRLLDWADNTKRNNISYFTTMLNDAVKAGIIQTNPMNLIPRADKIKMPESKREFLTADELRRLIDAPAIKQSAITAKCAFLFSCFCGLRYSDISALRWSEIQTDGKNHFIKKEMRKTKKTIIIPLCNDAVKWLPQQTAINSDFVFAGIDMQVTNYQLKKLAKVAGIDKKVTFHVARHTFATMLLTFGADLYTISKLLGHSSVQTTQIYAKIVDKKKVDAVGLFNGKF